MDPGVRILSDLLIKEKYANVVPFDIPVEICLPGGLETITLEGCTFNKGFTLNTNSKIEVKLINCVINEEFYCQTTNQTYILQIDNSRIDRLKIGTSHETNLYKRSWIGRIKQYSGKTRLFGFSQIDYIESNSTVEVYGSTIKKAIIRGGKIVAEEESILSDLRILNNSLVLIKNTKIRQLRILRINHFHSYKVSFRDCTINEIKFGTLQESHRVSLSNVTEVNNVQILNSNLNGVSLFRCNFSKTSFEVSNGGLKEILVDSVKWPNKPFIKIIGHNIGKNKNDKRDDQFEIRDLYRHLKIASIKQEDKINELKFYAFEMDAYYKTMSCLKPFTDKLILWVSRNTNYYGLNWWLPVIWYVVFTSGLYLLLVFLSVSPVQRNQIFCEQDFGRIFNPTHNIDNFELVNLKHSYLVLIDFLGRIFQGLLVYQTISAFRKFFK